MNNLTIEKTKSTLKVFGDANAGKIELSGSSFPENAAEFFLPILSWISSYMLEGAESIIVDFKVDYVNSSSIKYISDIIEKIEVFHKAGGAGVINWYYAEDDEDIQDMGNEFAEDVLVPFNLIQE